MRLLREDHQTGSRQLDLIADWGLPVLLLVMRRRRVATTGAAASAVQGRLAAGASTLQSQPRRCRRFLNKFTAGLAIGCGFHGELIQGFVHLGSRKLVQYGYGGRRRRLANVVGAMIASPANRAA